jgi:hypothetical protein
MFYDFAVVIPAGTPENSPVEQKLKLTAGLIIRIDVEFPAGCRGYVFATVMVGGHQLYPTNPEGAMNTEDFTVQAYDFYPLLEAPYQLKARAWSPDADYQHTLTVRVDLVRIEDLTRLLPFLQGLEKLLEYMGVSAEEKVTPVAEVAPPAAEIVPPICTVGNTKCEGNDLYECREVEGVADWVLKETNSTLCKAVQPPGPEPGPEPEPEPPPEPLPVPSQGEILEIMWGDEANWYPLSVPVPHLSDYYQRFKVKNTGKVKAVYRVAYYTTGYGEGYHYSNPVTLEPEQIAYITKVFYAGAKPGSYEITWHLFSYDTDVYQVTVTQFIGEEVK